MMSAMRNSPVILPPKPTTLALSSRPGVQGARHVADQGAAGAGHLVDGVGDADAGAAEDHAEVGPAGGHGLAHGLAVDRVVGAGVAVGAAVEDLVAGLLQAVVQVRLLVGDDVVAPSAMIFLVMIRSP